jgi:hypothetical protein
VFENYQQARTTFVQTIAELASRPQNIEALQNAGVMALLRPLLLDTVPSIQQSAALALGRLANYSEALAEAVVMNEVLPQLVYSLSDQNVRPQGWVGGNCTHILNLHTYIHTHSNIHAHINRAHIVCSPWCIVGDRCRDINPCSINCGCWNT